MLSLDDLLENLDFDSWDQFVEEVVDFLQNAFNWLRDFVVYVQTVVNEWYPIIMSWIDQVTQLMGINKTGPVVITNPEFKDGETISNALRNAAVQHVDTPLQKNGNFAFTLEGESIGKLASFAAKQDNDDSFRKIMEEHGGVIVLDDLN